MALLIGLKGGLGNQLFQFSHGINQSIKTGLPVCFFWEQVHSNDNTPREFQLSFLGIELNKWYKVEFDPVNGIKFNKDVDINIKKFFKKIHNQEQFHFASELILKNKTINQISGYWQGELFFHDNKSEIAHFINSKLNQLSPKLELNNYTAAIHLRFGDYFYSKKINQVHGTVSSSYLNKAIDLLSGLGVSSFRIYTDTIDLATNFLADNQPNLDLMQMPIRAAALDLADLRCYKSIIGSNSSFSWWASYLGNMDKTVILPRNWFERSILISNSTVDLFKPEWITIG